MSNVKSSEVNDMIELEPFSYITLIESGNNRKYNGTLSMNSEQLLMKVVHKFDGRIPVSGVISISDTSIKNKLEMEIEFLCAKANQQNNISNLKITPIIDSLIKRNEKRFGLITLAEGFKRTKGNYLGQMAKGIALGILTLGMYFRTPIKAYSTIYVMIVDTKENNIAFFNKSNLAGKDPLNEEVLKKQFNKIFEGYYWPKK